MAKPAKITLDSISKKNLKDLKNSIEFGVSYLRINPNNELVLTTNKRYDKGAGVYLNYSPNGIGRTLFANKYDLLMTIKEFEQKIN